MSVLNQSGEEQVECPLCMEPLEVDDLNFYPCSCGYQICRFCWHRIRTDENGLCPACRKAYSENPADFTPLSQEQVAKLKAEKRQRDQQRKAKLSENRKHLASVRVVQRNLVFVVGLPVRLADPEVLKRHEYFGKFGKIHKVVINQSTSYAGSQGPSASAYVTYLKSDDALRAIQSVNNITIDGRLIKSSLGTTKYCSHFLKNQTCPKTDCMYLHDYGDPEASFTKEEMHAGKHQEYEKKLHESLLMRNNNNSSSNSQNSHQSGTTTTTTSDCRNTSSAPIPTGTGGHSKTSSRETNGLSSSVSSSSSTSSSSDRDKREKEKNKKNKAKLGNTDSNWKERKGSSKSENRIENGTNSRSEVKETSNSPSMENDSSSSSEQPQKSLSSSPSITASTTPTTLLSSSSAECHLNQLTNKLQTSVLDDNSSFFSSNSFQKLTSAPSSHMNHNHTGENEDGVVDSTDGESHPTNILTDTLPNINTSEDWAAAFGFPRPSEPIVDVIGKRERSTPTLDSFRNGFGPLRQDHEYNKGTESYNGFYDIPSKVQENLLDLISSNTTKKNGFIDHTRHHQQRVLPLQTNLPMKPLLASNNAHVHHNTTFDGLDENMSKFFMNFHKNLKDLNSTTTAPVLGLPPPPPQQQQQQPDFPNGYNCIHHNNFFSGFTNPADRLAMMQQKQMEEQLLNLSLKQGFGNNTLYQNGLTQPQNSYMNGENGSGFGHIGGHGGGTLYGSGTSQIPSHKTQNMRTTNEDDLGFDPFQETQKAFADLIASEQNHKLHNTGRNQINGVVYNNGSHLPPPPPGFVQSNPHMNSFGSKILPFLNMSSSQQQINNQTQNSWPPNNYTSQLQSQQPQNSSSNTCNDWKVLDPAILTSTQHFSVPNMSTIRDYTNLNQQQQQLQNGPSHVRPFDFNTNNAFSNAFTQLQPNINSFTHLNTQQQNHINWFTSTDLNSQISSPPGFRANQTTKQQEC